MSKNDFRDMRVNYFINEVNGGDVNQGVGASTKLRLEDLISNILKVEDYAEFNNLFEMADKECESKTQLEIKPIIDKVVKKEIDSNEKRSSFLEKLKSCTYSVGNSVVAGLLLQCLKNLIF